MLLKIMLYIELKNILKLADFEYPRNGHNTIVYILVTV